MNELRITLKCGTKHLTMYSSLSQLMLPNIKESVLLHEADQKVHKRFHPYLEKR